MYKMGSQNEQIIASDNTSETRYIYTTFIYARRKDKADSLWGREQN